MPNQDGNIFIDNSQGAVEKAENAYVHAFVDWGRTHYVAHHPDIERLQLPNYPHGSAPPIAPDAAPFITRDQDPQAVQQQALKDLPAKRRVYDAAKELLLKAIDRHRPHIREGLSKINDGDARLARITELNTHLDSNIRHAILAQPKIGYTDSYKQLAEGVDGDPSLTVHQTEARRRSPSREILQHHIIPDDYGTNINRNPAGS